MNRVPMSIDPAGRASGVEAKTPITDPTKLFEAFGSVCEGHPDDERFYGMPRCTTDALHELLHDDDPGEDIQYRAMYAKAADAIEALAWALYFARQRLVGGNDVDQACVRGVDRVIRDAGLELSRPPLIASKSDVPSEAESAAPEESAEPRSGGAHT